MSAIPEVDEPKLLAVDRDHVVTWAATPGPVRKSMIKRYKEHDEWVVWGIDDADRIRDDLYIPGMKEIVEYFGLHKPHITRAKRLKGLQRIYPHHRDAYYLTMMDYELSGWNYLDPEDFSDDPLRLM